MFGFARVRTMNNFLTFLSSAKRSSLENTSDKKVHIVIGNETADLDSTVSTLLLAYFMSKLQEWSSAIVIPVINVPHNQIKIRSEVCYALDQCGIDKDFLVYKDRINFAELVKKKNVSTSLVDSHILSKEHEVLKDTVIQIFDHRPLDEKYKWSGFVRIHIEEVGSCATLIAEHILKNNSNILCRELAYLLYETIVYDTIGLKAIHGKVRDLDIDVAGVLKQKYHITDNDDELFDKLWKIHNDVTSLSNEQLLVKDLKIVEGVPVVGLPMLVEDYLLRDQAVDEIIKFANERQAQLVVLVGLRASGEVRRDIGIYASNGCFKNLVISHLTNSQNTKGYNLDLEEKKTASNQVTCFEQRNTRLSRKQIVPVIRDAALEQAEKKSLK